jgi:methionyl-tRNA formyltransferase
VQLREFAADLMVVAAYGVLLPPEVLSIPRFGCINIHASLLPRWRGAAPIQRAILAGDDRTGVAIMQMETGLDTGPVYLEAERRIAADDTTASLTQALAVLGAETLIRAIPAIAAGTLRPVPQAQEGVRYAHKVTKSEALLDWSRSAVELERAVRAYQPWPVAETRWAGAQLRIHAATVIPGEATSEPGQIIAAGPSGIDVSTGAGLLRLTRVQSAGRGIVDAVQFAQSEARKGALVGAALGAAA